MYSVFLCSLEHTFYQVRAGNVVDLNIIRTTSASTPSQPAPAPPVIEVSAVQTTDNVGDNDGDNEPMTIFESLQQRLAKYAEEDAKAKEAGNESKARRMGRIRKQYEDAIKLHKKGRPIPRDELPDPPNFPPIPISDPPTKTKPQPAPAASPSGPSPAAAASPSGPSQPSPAARTAAATPPKPAGPGPSVSPSPPKKGR